MKPYNVRDYWTNVAENIARRPGDKLVAGLETPFYAYKREKFVATFLGSIPAEGRTSSSSAAARGGTSSSSQSCIRAVWWVATSHSR